MICSGTSIERTSVFSRKKCLYTSTKWGQIVVMHCGSMDIVLEVNEPHSKSFLSEDREGKSLSSKRCCIDENESLCSRRLYPIRMNSSHIPTYLHVPTYLPTYLPTYVTYLRTYLPTYLPTCTYVPTYVTYLPTYLHVPTYLPTYLPTPTYLPAMKINMLTIGNNLRFAVLRKSTRLYLSLTLVACDKVRLVDSTVFACSSVVCPAFVALL